MASLQLISVGIGLVVLSLLLLVAFLQGSHATKSIYSMPSIASKEDGVFTSSLSMLMHASVDDVFGVLLNYKDYSWSSNMKYTWDDETPGVGSNGTITVSNGELGIICFGSFNLLLPFVLKTLGLDLLWQTYFVFRFFTLPRWT